MLSKPNHAIVRWMYYQDLNHFKAATGYDIEGIWYPRVTSIISIKAKPALYHFYANQENFAAGERVKKISAEEGTLVHETIEAILRGEEVGIPDSIQPSVKAFLDFKNQNELLPHQIETRIVSKAHHYAGTIDVLAELNGRLGVLDIKTSYAIYRDYGIQLAAYVEALQEAGSPTLARWVLRLDQARQCLRCSAKLRIKGGAPKVRDAKNGCEHVWGPMLGEFELKELPHFEKDRDAFLAAKKLWEWENEYWLRQV